mmetsp:Transcript_11557/g.27254  ORF Transcript_11557/g.27254 Transcript_11557/m.27254 type:complete len:180 (-) Transcript_11557:48-587(-)
MSAGASPSSSIMSPRQRAGTQMEDGLAFYFMAGMNKANAEGLNLFARAPSVPVAPAPPAAPSLAPAAPQSQGTFFRPSSADGCLVKDFFDRPRWNRSTVPKPGSSEGIRVKHTKQTAWGAENEDRRSLEAQARDLRVKVTSAELARCLRADVSWDAVIAPGLGPRSRPSSRGATWGKVR